LQANALLSVLDARRSLAGPPPQTWWMKSVRKYAFAK
jgi:hypothetical protein